jgi:four helix bundle protein
VSYPSPSNIAEGAGPLSTPEYKHFLGIERGSSFELLTQLTTAKELGIGDDAQIALAEDLSEEVRRMIFAMIATLKARQQ